MHSMIWFYEFNYSFIPMLMAVGSILYFVCFIGNKTTVFLYKDVYHSTYYNRVKYVVESTLVARIGHLLIFIIIMDVKQVKNDERNAKKKNWKETETCITHLLEKMKKSQHFHWNIIKIISSINNILNEIN